MRDFLRNNSLSVVLTLLFLVSIIGQVLAGWVALEGEMAEHGLAGPSLGAYLATGHFLSATFENWESEFLQMAVFVLLTASLIQKGSPESKAPDEVDEPPEAHRNDPAAPWPVRAGGWILTLYARSLGLSLTLLFLLSFFLHLVGSNRLANQEANWHGAPAETMLETLGSAEFWYESFQNWQSEFMSVVVLTVLGIYLRQQGSSQSKQVHDPHDKTGG